MSKLSKLTSIAESSSGSESDLESSSSLDYEHSLLQHQKSQRHRSSQLHVSTRDGRRFRSIVPRRSLRMGKLAISNSSSLSDSTWQCLIGHTGYPVVCLASCPAFGLIASGDACGRICIWDLASASFLFQLDASPSQTEHQQDYLQDVCGLEFNRVTGDLLVLIDVSTSRKGKLCR